MTVPKMGSFGPKHTYRSVLMELSQGFRDGTIVLSRKTPQQRAQSRSVKAPSIATEGWTIAVVARLSGIESSKSLLTACLLANEIILIPIEALEYLDNLKMSLNREYLGYLKRRPDRALTSSMKYRIEDTVCQIMKIGVRVTGPTIWMRPLTIDDFLALVDEARSRSFAILSDYVDCEILSAHQLKDKPLQMLCSTLLPSHQDLTIDQVLEIRPKLEGHITPFLEWVKMLQDLSHAEAIDRVEAELEAFRIARKKYKLARRFRFLEHVKRTFKDKGLAEEFVEGLRFFNQVVKDNNV